MREGEIVKSEKYTIINAKKLTKLRTLRIEGTIPDNLNEITSLWELSIEAHTDCTLDTSGMDGLKRLRVSAIDALNVVGFAKSITHLRISGASWKHPRDAEIKCRFPSSLKKLSMCQCHSKHEINHDMDTISIIYPRPDSETKITGKVKRIHMMGSEFGAILLTDPDVVIMKLVRCELPEVFDVGSFKGIKELQILECYNVKKIINLPESLEVLQVENYEPVEIDIGKNGLKDLIVSDNAKIVGEEFVKCDIEIREVRDPRDFSPEDYGIYGYRVHTPPRTSHDLPSPPRRTDPLL